ncbi:hypothetical protein [Sinomicrobium weinanense]|uniref:T9SS C-terminal target domain-containing protein n=1 Tax=Sinomicrobium weinanense TaxID=2842200 RepID=A0A926JUD5_9FLAO|nr:hypothetical protein [Sinomicrobium weinanense]MBC9797412.1 hypothetical protein [Sinomicrobium weinanense]MBU3123094.1 hypothetical protein [Sinomicrobium weinanense]
MKKINFLPIIALLAVFITACSGDDNNNGPIDDDNGDDGNSVEKSGILTEDEHWTADKVYLLEGKVVVDEGVTLTIDPGTIIKGKPGQESQASALVVDQGGKLMAEGTANDPIIFTAEADNIQPGELSGSNLDQNDIGLWGGVIVLGKAPISFSGDSQTGQIEGIPPSETFGKYGGTDPEDNSGSLKYISIRHGGITIGQDNEINGLTLGGVGSGTTIENIEVVANQDDGIEWFGGTVNVTNALVWAQGDDGFDTDEGWSGTLDNGVVIMGSESGTGLEMDGPAGTTKHPNPAQQHTLKNITLVGAGTSSKYADLRDGLLVNLENVFAYGFGESATVKINGEDSRDELANDNIIFSNWEIVLPEGAAIADIIVGKKPDPNDPDKEIDMEITAEKFTDNAKGVETGTVGANTSVFDWTYASGMGVEF